MQQNTSSVMQGYRLQVRFWLNLGNDLECWLSDQVSFLKSKRKFHETLVNALRLYLALLNRDISVLLELFPWVGDALQKPQPVAGDLPSALVAKLDRIEQALAYSRAGGGSDTPRAMPLPIDDPDEKIEITAAKSDTNPAFNNLISMAALSGDWGMLPDAVLEYGIKLGRVPESARRGQVVSKPVVVVAADERGAGFQMVVPQFAPPNFDDDDDLPIVTAGAAD